MKKIPTTIVTGFLGAGKTTIIRNLLQSYPNRHFALIINEFGDIGIDGDILRGCGVDSCQEEDGLIELANGCICCTVAEEFTPAMETLLARDPKPEHIIIETSGLALPQPLVRAFNWPAITTQATVDGVVVIVDCPAVHNGQFAHNPDAVDNIRLADPNLDHESPLAELFEDQLACADLIVLNKTDNIELNDLNQIKSNIRASIRDGVGIVSTRSGKISPQLIVGLGMYSETDLDLRKEIHHFHDEDDISGEAHGHDDFESLVLDLPEIHNLEEFIDLMHHAISNHDLLRVKGFMAVKNKPLRLVVQSAGPRIETYYDQPFSNSTSRKSRLVLIAQSGVDAMAIRSIFANAI